MGKRDGRDKETEESVWATNYCMGVWSGKLEEISGGSWWKFTKQSLGIWRYLFLVERKGKWDRKNQFLFLVAFGRKKRIFEMFGG